ncbi:sulfatase-like hydrolase/transferase [candidate division KSB1 bacterium]|nr:sulfatase-like hydrolase/transferase [candidate division KSB1 bacterium]
MSTTRRTFLRQIGATAILTALSSHAAQKKRPNILWLSCEDIGPHFGCYGDPHAHTPTLDKLAQEGVLYTHAFTVAGVCAPNRSSIITGVYANSLGTQHMRSGGEGVEVSHQPSPPAMIRCFSEYLRKEGYYCTNNSKQDYQFDAPASAWDESSNQAHWQNRPSNETPFFAVFNYTGTHEGSIRLDEQARTERTQRLTLEQRQDPDKLDPPPYYPDTPEVRLYWSRYYELITAMDYWIADRLQEIKQAGLENDTIVFFWSDHGVGMPRAKRWLYDSGSRVPLIVKIPGQFRTGDQAQPGTRSDQLVSSIDLPETVLNLTGLPIPGYMQGQPFLGPDLPAPRSYTYGFRDRMDERYDIIRTVRDKRYRYIRNYEPFKPYDQFIQSAERGPVFQEIRRIEKQGNPSPALQLFLRDAKPIEELYDLETDPHEINNLAMNPEYRTIRDRLWRAHLDWMLEIRDLGLIPEPELVRLDEKYGSRYAILRQPKGLELLKKLHAIASVAGTPSLQDTGVLLQALKDPFPSVRYWGVIGIGQLVKQRDLTEYLQPFLADPSAVVRVVAAGILAEYGNENMALPVLASELSGPNEWVRLKAAHELDRLGEIARPVIPDMQKALQDKENKYVVRVVNHALNRLLGTDNRVR